MEKSYKCEKGATFLKPGVLPSTKNKVFPRSYFNLVKNKVLVNSVIIETKIKHNFMFLLLLKSIYTKTFKKKFKEKRIFVTINNACI